MKLEERLFPTSGRKHSPFTDEGHWRDDDGYFPKHLELKKLRNWLFKNCKDYTQTINYNLISLQNDPNRIRFIDDLSEEVLAAIDKNKDVHLTLPEEVDYNRDEGQITSPLGVLKEYEVQLKRSIVLIEKLDLKQDYFKDVKSHFQEGLQLIDQIKEDTKTDYTLAADFEVHIKKSVKPKWEKQPNHQYAYSKTKTNTSYDGELTIMHDLITTERIRDELRVFPIDIKRSVFELFNSSIYASGIVEGTINQTVGAVPRAWKLGDGDEFTVHAQLTMEQKKYTNFETQVIFKITHQDKHKDHVVKMKNSLGYPFQGAILRQQSSKIESQVEKLSKRIDAYDHLFNDLATIYQLAQTNRFLREKGANKSTISEDGKELIVATNVKNPLMTLNGNEGKPVIPNDVYLTTDKNVHIATGANLNGKSVQGISQVQNLVMAQGNLYVFCETMTYTPIDKVIAIFGDYKGSTTEGESRHSMDCKQLEEGLRELTSRSFFMPDEIGTGTDPEGGAQLAYETWELLAKTKTVMAYIPTHFKDKVHLLAANHSNVHPMAFDLDENDEPTYKAKHGEIAVSSEAAVIAKKYGVDQEGLQRIQEQWKEKGIIR